MVIELPRRSTVSGDRTGPKRPSFRGQAGCSWRSSISPGASALAKLLGHLRVSIAVERSNGIFGLVPMVERHAESFAARVGDFNLRDRLPRLKLHRSKSLARPPTGHRDAQLNRR